MVIVAEQHLHNFIQYFIIADMGDPKLWRLHLLVPGFMGDGECQTQAGVFINGAAAVFAAHPTNWSKTCKTRDAMFQFLSLFGSEIYCNQVITLILVKLCLHQLNKYWSFSAKPEIVL